MNTSSDLLEDNERLQFWKFKGKEEYVDRWFLMDSPFLMALISLTYLAFVLKLGQKFMKNRPAFDLTFVLGVYNFLQVILSGYILYIGIRILSTNGILGKSCFMETEESRYIITSSIYTYFIAKVTELCDTIFFVLRKKYNQITFLHVYHHFLMFWSPWFVVKYEPSISTVFLGTLNSFVHIIMYSYYGLSAFPSMSKYLWWKKYITRMQLIQFVCVISHAAASTFLERCPPSNTLKFVIIMNASLFIYLFGKFYVNAYIKSKTNNLKNNEINIPNSKNIKVN